MLVVQQIAELVEVQIVEQVVEQRAETAAEQIVELIGEQVVELVVEQTVVMAGAGSVARPAVAAEELKAEFETAVETSVSEQAVAGVATDVDKPADAVGTATVDVVELLAAGAAAVLIVTASDYLQEEKVKLDLLSY